MASPETSNDGPVLGRLLPGLYSFLKNNRGHPRFADYSIQQAPLKWECGPGGKITAGPSSVHAKASGVPGPGGG